MPRKRRCQVCGVEVADHQKNCGSHMYVSERMVSLAQDIWRLNRNISTDLVFRLAEKHKCSTSTVRKYLKNQGFLTMRGWRREGENPFA